MRKNFHNFKSYLLNVKLDTGTPKSHYGYEIGILFITLFKGTFVSELILIIVCQLCGEVWCGETR